MTKDRVKVAKLAAFTVAVAVVIPVVAIADAAKAYINSVREAYVELYHVVSEAFSG